MGVVDFIRNLRGKITGLNAISARLDVLQMQIDRLNTISEKLSVQVQQVNQSKEPNLEAYLSEEASSVVGTSFSELKRSDDRNLRFNKVLQGEKIRLVFLIIFPELWPSLEPVWMRATQDDRFQTWVVILNNANPDMALTSQSKARALLESKGIPFFTEQTFSLESHRPHVIFYPSPYEMYYPQPYKPEIVAEKGFRIAYVPYGLEVGGGMSNARYQYDSDVPRIAWRIFARSQAQLASFGRHCSRGNGHVVVTGHPRLEFGDSRNIPLDPVVKSKAMGRKVILWTPHFSVASRRKWSSFLDHHKTILKLIDNRPDLFLLVRPHPFLRTTLAKLSDWGGEHVAAWFNAINERGNAHVDTGTDYHSAFEVSSALMTDAGSFMVEYLRAGKPICHLTSRDDIGLTEEVRNLTCFYPGATESDIAGFLDRVQSGDDTLSGARRDALQTYFGPGDQKPSQAILNEIANNIDDLRRTSRIVPSSNHEEAFQYWVKATTTFLAPETYYQEQEKKLRDILKRHAQGRFAADIGCGNGRFTELFSNHFEFIEATDPNDHLISDARENAKLKGISNIAYTVERLEHAESLSTYDFVSCMGVTSGLIDDDVFLKSIWRLKAAMRPGSKLLMKDSLSLSTPEFIEWNGYKAVYRNISAYLAAFEAAGLSLVEEQIITEDNEKKRTNRLFVFKIKTPLDYQYDRT